MRIRTLLGGAAMGAVLIASNAWAADAPAAHSPAAHRKHPHKAPPPAAASKDEVSALAGEVKALKQNLASETAAREALQSQVQTAVARADAAEAEVKTTRAQLAAANDAAIKTIPMQVANEVKKEQRSADGLYVKGVKITPGGFLEAAEVYRQHDTANDISTALNTIPFPQTRQGHAEEYLFTPRQSRVSALVEGKPTSDITLSMYGEFDFQGAAQSANSNESNSYNPRIRHFYGTIDWADSGWHFLTGQTFSLVTLDSKGITPRNEVTPLTIDGQYHVGFTWTRQPVVRLTKDMMDKHLWISVSAENPQTTFTGTVPAGVINNINNGQGFFGGATNALAPSTQSLNHVPDFIAKVAVEEDLAGHHLHAELLGLARDFYVQDATFADKDTWTGAVGGGLSFQVVPGLFDIQATGLLGRGVGRYASGQLPDVTFSPDGRVQPIRENIWLLGAILHANKSLDLWAYAGQERDERAAFGAIGYGNPLFVNSGCDIEGSALTCTGNTRALTELSAGFWQKFYSGPWGHAQVGLQYSHIERDAFSGVGGAPEAHENMVYTSFRYYPFQ
ncbi:MAG TPA: hypothetical protein VFE18_03210 [Phenylobacterium sp.]|jgi:hypothetical protein|uniref:hypothetical protein n=1 Tax=Phenylobacterium sp. TaxID=1871053 RepID=UPI002D304946|nr:hypothetical protein [Phenylobacterium sp.]HZZ67160.1 hypothetical protein [Phenylobacterium sp.]